MNMQKYRVALITMLTLFGVAVSANEFSHNDKWSRHGAWMEAYNQSPTIQADRTTLENDFQKLRGDQATGDTAAVAADQATLKDAATQQQADIATLKLNVKNNGAVHADKTVVSNDRAKLWADRIQAQSDTIAGNTDAVATDKATLTADQAQLQADIKKLKQGVSSVIAVPLR